jgi:hypothetical protein
MTVSFKTAGPAAMCDGHMNAPDINAAVQSSPPTPASSTATGLIAGTLHARHMCHPWLDRATEVTWSRLGHLAEPGGYEMFRVDQHQQGQQSRKPT